MLRAVHGTPTARCVIRPAMRWRIAATATGGWLQQVRTQCGIARGSPPSAASRFRGMETVWTVGLARMYALMTDELEKAIRECPDEL